MKQKMSISYIRLIGNHTLSCAILGINCTPNGLKLHLLRSYYYFRPLLVHLFPNCTQNHAIIHQNYNPENGCMSKLECSIKSLLSRCNIDVVLLP